MTKQQLKSKETKEKIFQAAKNILQRSGYESLSIKNLCEEAGVSNGSFYHHFRRFTGKSQNNMGDNMYPDLLQICHSLIVHAEGIASSNKAGGIFVDGLQTQFNHHRLDLV